MKIKNLFLSIVILFFPSTFFGQTVVTQFEEACQIARIQNTYVFVYFDAEWCSSCKTFEKQTLETLQIKDDLRNYIVVTLDTDRHPIAWQIFKESFKETPYQIRYIPSYFLVDPITRIPVRWGNGYKSVYDFQYWLRFNK